MNGPKALEPAGLALGYYRSRRRSLADRVFTDWSFANGIFTNGIFTNRRGLDDGLRTGQIRGNRRSHQSQRRSTRNYESQHSSLP
jgi:hypothetical protein